MTPIAIAGVLTSTFNTFATLLFSILIAFAFIMVVIPVVGLPLVILLKLSANVLSVDNKTISEIFRLMLGGISVSSPLLAILLVVGLGLRVWRSFIEARRGRIGLAVTLIASLIGLLTLFYIAVKSKSLFGIVGGIAAAFLTAPTVLAVPLLYLLSLYDSWIFGEGASANNQIATVTIVLTAAAVALVTYIFYSLLSAGLVIVTGLSTSRIFRQSLRFQLSASGPTDAIRRFRIVPMSVDVVAALLILLRAILISTLVGLVVLIVYFGVPYLNSTLDGMTTWLRTVGNAIVDQRYALLSGIFLTGSTLLLIGTSACLFFRMPWLPSLQLKEWMAVLLVSPLIFIPLARMGDASRSDLLEQLYGMLPITLIILMARGLLWRALLEGRERLLSGQQRAVEHVIKNSETAPVLYLRAFLDDGLTVGRGFRLLDLLMGMPVRRRRFEEIVAGRAFHWRPIVALGNPHIPFNLHGVLKKSVAGQDWKSEVEYWHKRSAYVLMIANKTDNIAWEIELIRQTRGSESAIFVVTSTARAREFFDHYAIISKDSRVPDNTLVVYRDPSDGWVALTSRLRSEIAYTTALDIALARTESAMSKSSQAALTHLAS